MDRRSFLQAVPIGAAAFAAGYLGMRQYVGHHLLCPECGPAPAAADFTSDTATSDTATGDTATGDTAIIDPVSDEGALPPQGPLLETAVGPYAKIREFDRSWIDDVFIERQRIPLLHTLSARLARAQNFVGHGHFNLLGFDELLQYGRNFAKVGRFQTAEQELLDEVFHTDAARYGFFGDKVLDKLGARISKRDTQKVPGSGHSLLRGSSLDKYQRIRRDVGGSLQLTSGIRGLAKQFQLFLAKVVETEGNLSQASRSLAPPGYSYHAVGDFDVGKQGFGLDNFTESFANTDEYKRLIELGYVAIRYTETNPFGVRHEPWHIKIS